jgi:hypothetical protein
MFKVPVSEVTPEQRRYAKTESFFRLYNYRPGAVALDASKPLPAKRNLFQKLKALDFEETELRLFSQATNLSK